MDKGNEMAGTYKIVELVGTSPISFAEAIKAGVAEASKTIRHMDWFEVVEERGRIVEGAVHEFQVTIKVDRKSTRLNSSHLVISYAVFSLKTKSLIRCSSAPCRKALAGGVTITMATDKKKTGALSTERVFFFSGPFRQVNSVTPNRPPDAT